MSDNRILDQSCRVALAAFIHDIGKFAERARIPEAQIKNAEGVTRQEINEHLYCNEFNGRRTHIHSAYTAIAMDILEKNLPEIVGADMSPFAPWHDRNADDSIINAAAKHHKPDTSLQWIIATADRIAAGFERSTFDTYNMAADETDNRKLNHYTTKQEALLEHIRLSDRAPSSNWRYPLKPLSPLGVFPQSAKEVEKNDKIAAQKEYLDLWQSFIKGLNDIPASHRSNISLWLDHFDSLWLTFTHAIPSATAGGIRPDVSLYDHSKTTAALAVSLWRYHLEMGHTMEAIREELRAQWDVERENSPQAQKAWNEQKFLLIQGDFFGIQDFIFSEGSQTQKQAAKLLRGRSFYVALLTEIAALKILDMLGLPSTSQVVNAAGKFLILAHNTPPVVEKLKQLQAEFDKWFITHTYAQSGIGLAWLPAAARDFKQTEGGKSPFQRLMKRLFEEMELAKLKRYELCGQKPPTAIFYDFLNQFHHGECKIDSRLPATKQLTDDIWVSALAYDQIQTGKYIATQDRLFVSRSCIEEHADQHLHTLELPIFGYYIQFTQDEGRTGKFGEEARSGNLLRAWDFSLPKDEVLLWNGYARRYINAYIPRFVERDLDEHNIDKYKCLDESDRENERIGFPKTLNHIAREDRQLNSQGRWIGVEALMTLKGDVDNLGKIFQVGLEQPTFAKMAELSRQINAFFAIYLPWLCYKEEAFRNIYTVFAGGDDFFIIGPWYSTMKLALQIKKDFKRYVAENPDIHFSAGLTMTKPGLPIRQMASSAEDALERAKGHKPEGSTQASKNSVTCFDQTVTWDDFEDIMKSEVALSEAVSDFELSKGYLYGLLYLIDMSKNVNKRPENAIWHSYFRYRTRRLAEMKFREGDRSEKEKYRREFQERLASVIKSQGIEKYKSAYKIALFTHLYKNRE